MLFQIAFKCNSAWKKRFAVVTVALLALACFTNFKFDTEKPVERRNTSSENDYIMKMISSTNMPLLDFYDKVYNGQALGWQPIVVEKYNLIFFPISGVASTEFKKLFIKMSDDSDEDELFNGPPFRIDDPYSNGLKYLSYYAIKDAGAMLNSDEWTKAMFVREPKEKLLSAFLGTVINGKYFHWRCCSEIDNPEKCEKKIEEEDFGYFLQQSLSSSCSDPNWSSQASTIDSKWWSVMNYIGYANNLAADAKTLLKSLKDSNGKTAWQSFGKTGWGPDKKDAFLADMNLSITKKELKKYYNSCNEEFVEKNWKEDYNNTKFHFDKINLYKNHDAADCK